MTGAAQERRLLDNLAVSRARWNVLAQQTMMMRWNLGSVGAALGAELENLFNVDAWDGYPDQRDRLMRFLAAARPGNPVVLTGDIEMTGDRCTAAIREVADVTDPESPVSTAAIFRLPAGFNARNNGGEALERI